MKLTSDILAVIGFFLLVDWKIIPEWIFVHFIQHKHGNFYNKFDNLILHYARGNWEIYDSKKSANVKFLAFLSLLLSGIISLISDFDYVSILEKLK